MVSSHSSSASSRGMRTPPSTPASSSPRPISTASSILPTPSGTSSSSSIGIPTPQSSPRPESTRTPSSRTLSPSASAADAITIYLVHNSQRFAIPGTRAAGVAFAEVRRIAERVFPREQLVYVKVGLGERAIEEGEVFYEDGVEVEAFVMSIGG